MSRFGRPSSSLRLAQLLRDTRPIISVGLVVAFAAHLGLGQLRLGARQHRPVRPMTTRFVKRLPRLTKPLEMRKRPRPKQRQVQRRMISVQARSARTQSTARLQLGEAIRSLARPQIVVGRSASGYQTAAEPVAFAQTVQSTKESGRAVDMSLEMVGIDALDTGRYQAMVIQDPTDKRNIRGYLHLVLIHLMSVAELSRANIIRTDVGIKRLVESLNESTDINADVVATSDFASPVALETPWVYLTTYKPFELTPAEQRALGRYVTHGGFLFCDEHIWVRYATYVSVAKAFKTMVALGCETQGLVEGRDWHTGEVPPQHPLFHCYYDFDGPPIGYNFSISSYPIYREEPMIGVFVHDALVGIIARRSYAAPWYGKGWSGSAADTSQLATRPRAVQFGINTIVYALTREGSITSQVMDVIR